MNNIRTNKIGSYQPEIIKPIIRITDEPAPFWLVYSKSREQEYTILCEPLKVQEKRRLRGLKTMEATVYYSKLVNMDKDGKALIYNYLTPVTYEWPEEEEESTRFQTIKEHFGEAAAWELFDLKRDIHRRSRKWYYTMLAAEELRESVAYMYSDYEERLNYQLPDDFYDITEGMYDVLWQSKLKSEEHVRAAFYAGYLKGSREAGQPIPPLIKGGEAAQNLIFSQYGILL